jgi:ketosteroid isomerase-like protein
MSRENVEVVRRLFEAAGRRDTAAVLSLYDPAVEWDASRGPTRNLMGAGVHRGHEGLRRFFREWNEAWKTIEYDYRELIDAGERVISVGPFRGRGRTSGVETAWADAAAIWTVHDGKVVRVVWFTSREEALEALGRRE